MAHIADLMGEGDLNMGLNNYIARELSPPLLQQEPVFKDLPAPRPEEKEKFVWRMHQPTKYQLFPSKRESQGDMLLSGNSDKASSILGTCLGGRLKEASIVRRRKVSVPDLMAPTPMATVQEVPLDSPTIPGRPALHERSISFPGNDWRQHNTSCITGPVLDEKPQIILDNSGQEINAGVHLSRTFTPPPPRQPLSPKSLAPLVIPQTSSRMNIYDASSRSRSESIPPNVPPKSARMRDASSPFPRASPYTPASATSLLSASTAPTSVSNTPSSAFASTLECHTPFPPSWHQSNDSTTQLTALSANPSPAKGHSRNQSNVDNTDQRTFVLTHAPSHRRHESDSAASIMHRGRPKKRSELSPSANSSPIKSRQPIPTSVSPLRDETAAKDLAARAQAKAEAQHAFEHLPTGTRPHLAPNQFPLAELASLKKQALGQASRFHVLPTNVVEGLSRELRALDERCEYLRKTHRSLRAGRRNLHERICNYLRGERTAVFSRESLLRQEEALSELDNSIDDWVAKLEQAENRRTRIRQKLLEHVAAALIIPQPPASSVMSIAKIAPSPPPPMIAPSPPPMSDIGNANNPLKAHLVAVASSTQIQTKVLADPNTPPRSPTKGQSPERRPRSPAIRGQTLEKLERVVKEIKSSSPEPPKRSGVTRQVESVRIYAESDVYALLADVEEEIERMGTDAVAEELSSKVFAQAVKVEKRAEVKKEEVLSPGIRLHAVAFEGMIAHKKSVGMMRA